MTDTINCPKCHKFIKAGIPFCPHCGERQTDNRVRDEFGKDPYYILQVSNHAEPEVIEAAYKNLAKKYHPDVDSSPQAQEKMKELNWAYDILSNPTKKSEYDRKDQSGQKSYQSDQTRQESTKENKPPKPKKSEPKRDYQTPASRTKKENKAGWDFSPSWVIVAGIIVIFAAIYYFSGFFSTSSGSTSQNISSNNNNIYESNTSSTIKPINTPINEVITEPTKNTRKIPTNTPRLEFEYYELEIYEVGSNEIIDVYKAIDVENVERHVGEKLVVCGTVAGVRMNNVGKTYINFMTKNFSVIISESNISKFKDIIDYIKMFEEICVYGVIYKENNSIQLEPIDPRLIFGDFWEEYTQDSNWQPTPYYEPRYEPQNDDAKYRRAEP